MLLFSRTTENLLPLFGPSQRIRNAANPPIDGADAARRLLEDFFRRTTSRHFTLIDMAEGDGEVFACWTGELTFAPGVTIGDVCLQQPLTVALRGVERFHCDANGQVVELDIVHETTTIVQAVRAAACQTR